MEAEGFCFCSVLKWVGTNRLLFGKIIGTTLRTFLSKLLNCDPMRISKKFVGQNCIGKQVFRRRQVCTLRNQSNYVH